MTRRGKRNLFAFGVLAVAALAWLLVPSPFAHGVIVGSFGAAALALGAGFVFARTVLRKRMATGLKPPPLPVTSWDYALEAQDLNGATMTVSAYRGRVLVLNFWATWCAPCLAEMPSLERLQAATADVDVALVCLTQEQPTAVRTFVEKRGLAAPILLYSSETPACFGHRGIPATYVIDKVGTIVMRHVGAARWDDPAVVAFVRGLAATPNPESA